MKIVTIEPVAEPADFKDVRFARKDWEAAVKLGPIRNIPYGTAAENIRNSGGMYQIVTDKKVVEVEMKGLKDPVEMTKEELVMEMTAWGKPPRKQMSRKACEDFIRDLRSKAVDLISDDDEEED